MSSRILFAIIFLTGAVFQSVTVFFLIRGSDHYILRLVKRPVAIGFYMVFIAVMLFLGIRLLAA